VASAVSLKGRKSQGAAWIVSIVLHGMLLALLASSASGRFVAAASDTRGDMVVSLVSPSALAATAETASLSGDLRPLLAKFNPDQPPVPLDSTQNEMSELLQRLQSQESKPAAIRQAERDTETHFATATSSSPTEKPADQTGDEAGRAGSPGGLWGVLEPCWRKLSGGNLLPVTLDVTLDLRGRIAKPPEILRAPGVPINEPRLQSEARALSALAACMPHTDRRLGGQSYRLEFRPTRTSGTSQR
jgi:hypothetical protein